MAVNVIDPNHLDPDDPMVRRGYHPDVWRDRPDTDALHLIVDMTAPLTHALVDARLGLLREGFLTTHPICAELDRWHAYAEIVREQASRQLADLARRTCDGCGGTGYLVGQTYEAAEIPKGAIPVQRCDQCQRFDGDENAARAFAVFVGGRRVIWCDAGDRPGDWAVIV